MKTIWTDKILQLIHNKPCIRQVELADLADCDLDQVERSIQMQIDTGLIIRFETPGPNGRMQLAYKIDPELDAELVQMVIPDAKPLQSPQAAPQAAFPTRETVKPPELPRNTAPTGQSKQDMAVEFIENAAKAGMQVTDDDLRRILGIKPPNYPSSWLTMPIKAGRVHKAGRFWLPGREPTFQPERVAELEAKLDAAAARAEQRRKEAAPIENPGVDIDVPVYRKSDNKEIKLEVPAAVELAKPIITVKPEALAAREAELIAQGTTLAERKAEQAQELAEHQRQLEQRAEAERIERERIAQQKFEEGANRVLQRESQIAANRAAIAQNQSEENETDKEEPTAMATDSKTMPVFGKPSEASQTIPAGRHGELSLAIWNDGQLQIARAGKITETLTLAEVTTLCAYLSNTIEVRRAAKEREKSKA